MWVGGVKWKKCEADQWCGSAQPWGNLSGIILADMHTNCFVVMVHCLGKLVHQSEHACLCEAQKAGSEAMRRAHDLREGAA